MQLEHHQLDLRYESLRRRNPHRERRLLASLLLHGQQVPIVVVCAEGQGFVVIDGYKRLRALRHLKRDTVQATLWDLSEADALLLSRLMRDGEGHSALEQGWMLQELVARFGLSGPELGRRFDRSPSWVSRRLALVTLLPLEVQQQVREGALPAHAAQRHLVPLARANPEGCLALCAALGRAKLRPSSRQVGALCAAFARGDESARKLLLADPALVLRAEAEMRRGRSGDDSESGPLQRDLAAIEAAALRAARRLSRGHAHRLLPGQRQQAADLLRRGQAAVLRLCTLAEKELC